jgi:ubiquinone/menaquinone biosynthesis C-methylase UbiE
MSSSGGLDDRAVTGFAKSAAYDQYRPTYSSTIVQFLLEKLGVAGKNGAKILDLAAGTGKFTEALAARDEDFQIVAVEPHDGMRQVLDDKKLAHVTVKAGKADKIPLEDESVDAVICAQVGSVRFLVSPPLSSYHICICSVLWLELSSSQSFHWFANMDSLKEIHRVLASHGSLGMVWNIDDYNTAKSFNPETQWETKLHELTWTFDDELPRFRHDQWRNVFDEQIEKTPLSMLTAGDQLFTLPLGEHHEKFETRLSKDKVWERYNTLSHIAKQEAEDREVRKPLRLF